MCCTWLWEPILNYEILSVCGKQNVIVLGKSEELGQKNEFDCEELCDFNGMVDILCHWSGKICNPAHWIWLNWTDSNCLSCEKSNKVNAMRTTSGGHSHYGWSQIWFLWQIWIWIWLIFFRNISWSMVMMIYDQYDQMTNMIKW